MQNNKPDVVEDWELELSEVELLEDVIELEPDNKNVENVSYHTWKTAEKTLTIYYKYMLIKISLWLIDILSIILSVLLFNNVGI